MRFDKEKTFKHLAEHNLLSQTLSSLGSQPASTKRTSPAFTISASRRFTGATLAPRGLQGGDHRPHTEFAYDVPPAIGPQVESTRPTSSRIQFSRNSSRFLLYGKSEMTEGGGAGEGLGATSSSVGSTASKRGGPPLPVSSSLYNPAKYGPTGTVTLSALSLDEGDKHGSLSMSPIVSSIGPQVLSSQRTSPTLAFGVERRLKPSKPPLCSNLYDISAGEAVAHPRPATALCSVSGRTGLFAKKFVTTDYDFAPTGVPGAGTYSPERSTTLVKESAPAFSMGKPKKVHRATDYLRF